MLYSNVQNVNKRFSSYRRTFASRDISTRFAVTIKLSVQEIVLLCQAESVIVLQKKKIKSWVCEIFFFILNVHNCLMQCHKLNDLRKK